MYNPRSVPLVYGSPYPSTLSLSLQQNLVSPYTSQRPSAILYADSSRQTFRCSLIWSLARQDSVTRSLQQQKEELKNSLTEYQNALRQAKMMISDQLVCVLIVISACEVFQRDAPELTAQNECRKQLNKKIMEKAVSAF